MATVHRLLSAEEIALQRTGEPAPLRLPDPASVFADRAARLAVLADGHPMAGYLDLIGALARAQDRVARIDRRWVLPDATALARANEHRMPPLAVATWPLDPAWRQVLSDLLAALRASAAASGRPVTEATAALLDRLHGATPEWLDDQARRILNDRALGLDRAAAIFIGAALQVVWSRLVGALGEAAFPRLPAATVCPCCGSRPVASVMRASGNGSHRYLACRLCGSEWYLERIKCASCESTAGIEYFHSDEVDPVVKAETCSACHTYTKLVASERIAGVDPVADDLATLSLDMALAEQTDFHRAALNLAFFPGEDDDG